LLSALSSENALISQITFLSYVFVFVNASASFIFFMTSIIIGHHKSVFVVPIPFKRLVFAFSLSVYAATCSANVKASQESLSAVISLADLQAELAALGVCRRKGDYTIIIGAVKHRFF